MNILKKIFGQNVNEVFIYNYAQQLNQVHKDFYTIDVSDNIGQFEAYKKTPIINTIIDKVAQMASNCQVYVENDANETIERKDILKLLQQPNGLQNQTEFIQNFLINYNIFGECFILPIKLEGLSGIRGFFILPNFMVQVMYDYSKLPYTVNRTNGIKYIVYQTPDGAQIDLTPKKDDIIVIRNTNDLQYIGKGMSKLIGLEDHVNKYLISVNAGRELLENYGAIGMWVNRGKDEIGQTVIDEKEKEAIQQNLREKYGLTSGKFNYHVTNQNLAFERVNAGIQDLGLNAAALDSARAICDTFSYPIDLLSFEKNSTLQSSGGRESEAKRTVVTEAVQPAMNKLSEALSRLLLPESEHIKFYYDHLSFMQTSEKEKAELNKMYVDMYDQLLQNQTITAEEHRAILINLEILPK